MAGEMYVHYAFRAGHHRVPISYLHDISGYAVSSGRAMITVPRAPGNATAFALTGSGS